MFKSWPLFATRYFYFAGREARSSDDDEDYNLMVECPWRFEKGGRIVVGSEDYEASGDGSADPALSRSSDQAARH